MLHERTAFHAEEDDAALLKMPPHLAARFYKPNKPAQRRRSSSTSSTGPGYVHPTERAHSRRLKFLESRKSRLAAQALHAEKVRSRVNHGSHQMLSARLQALNDSLAAAKGAREALLAKTAANCASEVAKAKAIAEEVRLKREDEIRAIKDGVQDKLNAAEERRLELLKARQYRRPRGSSASLKTTNEINEVIEPLRQAVRESVAAAAAAAPSSSPRKSTEEIRDSAARRIQRTWLAHRNAVIVSDFTSRRFTIDTIKDMSFEAATSTIQDAEFVKATGNLLRLGGLLEDDETANITKACRTFLSAYLILGHPAEVLSNDGESEKALITQSRDLLCGFESWISTANAYNGFRGSTTSRQAFVDAYRPFSIAFNAWKERDQLELLNGMISQFVELDALWQTVKSDSEPQVAAEFKESIQENQMMILSRMKAIGGKKATEMLRKAIARSRRRLHRKHADKKPRAVITETEAANASTAQSIDLQAAMQQVEDGVKADDGSALSYQTAFDDESRFKLTNRQIAHELLLDHEFRFKERAKDQIEQTVEYQAKKAFYDLMREDITSGELERWIPSMAETVRQKLLRLVSPGSSVHQMISNAIDIELIAQQCRAKTYDHVSFFTFIYSLLPKLCSPARDEACQALINDPSPNQDYIARLEKLLDFLELMQLDHANYHLMMAAPHIIPHATQYEQHMFADDLAAGRFTLSRTKAWLKPAIVERVTELQSRDVENVNHPRQVPTAFHLVNQGYVSLFVHLNSLSDFVVPETFHLDIERVVNIYAEVHQVVVSSAMLLTIKSLLRKDARTVWRPLREKIAELIEANSMTAEQKSEQLVGFMREDLAVAPTEAQLAHISGAARRLFGNIETAMAGDSSGLRADPVVKVMLARLRSFVLARLNAQAPKDKVRLASGAADTLTSFGMAEQIAEIGGLLGRILALAGTNRESYGQWYDEIVREVLTEMNGA
ncbi:hypothetical protein DRE_04879 [Drechslerella stenobrocha 248]|uniref:Uncharacterized protein n=1 Tax=Drechslerella stenobrocha 248 TaxID=1043628 RepID=W7I066_9PEZI|nr:hypothetical protein DRE_04879 [Drechslerella stenobrocha 248]